MQSLVFFLLLVPHARSFTDIRNLHRHQLKQCVQRPLSMRKNPFDVFQRSFDKDTGSTTTTTTTTTSTAATKIENNVIQRVKPVLPKEVPSIQEPSTSTTSKSIAPSQEMSNKFDMGQRIESFKCAVIGALSGSIAVAPVALLYHITSSIPQWELTTDLAAVQGALFAIVYRYAIREDDNPMLNQGVLGAFVLVRTLPTIQASSECSALPLSCGPPIGYFNWSMLNQAVTQGIESVVLFGGTYLALEYAFSKGWISKFK